MVRIKHRYLLVNILYPSGSSAVKGPIDGQDVLPDTVKFYSPTSDGLTPQLIVDMVRRGAVELFGDYGAGVVAGSLRVMHFSPATSTIILRVARAHYRIVWAALTYTTHLPHPVKEPCVMQVIRVSGTIRKAQEAIIARSKEKVRKARIQVEERQELGTGRSALSFEGKEGFGNIESLEHDTEDTRGIEDDDMDVDDLGDEEVG
ncbi:MAG: hypothetical protein M1820_001124 [Bogoriella megaspora]|nr:MAG: hypothetical protein M1820_001124 [Bogoriella megaspora]